MKKLIMILVVASFTGCMSLEKRGEKFMIKASKENKKAALMVEINDSTRIEYKNYE